MSLADRYDAAVVALETAIVNADLARNEKVAASYTVVRRKAIDAVDTALRDALKVLRNSPGDRLRELEL